MFLWLKKIIDSLFSKEIEQRMSTMSVQEKIKKKKDISTS